MASLDVLADLGSAALDVLTQVADRFTTIDSFERLLLRHGWLTPDTRTYLDDVSSVFALLDDVPALASDLEVLRSASDPDADEVTGAVQAVIKVLTDLHNLTTSGAHPTLPFPINSDAFWSTFPRDVLETEIVLYLAARRPGVHAVLRVFGLIDEETINTDPLTGRLAHTELRLRWERLTQLILNPKQLAADVYGWGGQLDHAKLVHFLDAALGGFSVPSEPERPTDTVLAQYYAPTNSAIPSVRELTVPLFFDTDVDGFTFEAGLRLLPVPPADDKNAAPVGIVISPYFEGAAATEIPLGGRFDLILSGDVATGALLGIELRPGKAAVTAAPGTTTGDFQLKLVAQPDDPVILIGRPDGSRVQIKDAIVGLEVVGPLQDPDLRFKLGTSEVRVVVEIAAGDGFLGDLFGNVDIDAHASAAVVWSSKTGLSFEGAGTMRIDQPVHLTLGPVAITNVAVAITGADQSTKGNLTVSASATLGPVGVVVKDVGLSLTASKVADGGSRGLLGDLDLSFGFAPPTGVGLSVNAGPVSGGGFISFDPDAGRYSGALALQVYSVAVKAFGVIDTKFPDGHRGFSFFIIISAEFQPIQLGFGFTLLGVGGLIGINRDLNAEALAAAVKAGSLDNILFPKDPIRDAPTILHDVEAIFPPTKGFYAFGPLARIGWGTPAIIDARIGIVLVFPGPKIALLGAITALLPPGAKDPQLRLVEVHMDVDGILDFPKKHFEMDAHLHDSQVRGFPISGDMAARMDWGQNPNFAVSMGGFNAHYTPPSKFPKLRRLSIDLGIKGNPSATLQGYMALTSNTAQVGAALNVSAHANGASLNGGLAFDALFVFSPFSFDATLEGGVHVDFHGAGFGMHFHGEISGPAPWHLRGDVCVSVLWWDACVGFDLTLGGDSKPELPAIDLWAGSAPDANGHQDVPGLQSAVTSAGNWTGVLPPGGYQIVSITQNDSTHSRVDPLGVATFQQKVAPLQLSISKFAGRSRPKNDVVTVTLQTLTVNAEDLVAKQRTKSVSDFFAPVQYQSVPDSQALSSPSFQQLPAGFNFSSDDIVFGTQKTQTLGIQTIIVGSTATPVYNVPDDTTLLKMTGRSATATGGLRKANIDRFVDFAATVPFALATEVFVLAFKSNLTRYSGDSAGDAAYALKADKLATLAPDLRASLQIVPLHELPS